MLPRVVHGILVLCLSSEPDWEADGIKLFLPALCQSPSQKKTKKQQTTKNNKPNPSAACLRWLSFPFTPLVNKAFLQVKKAQLKRADFSCPFLVRCFGELGCFPSLGLGLSSVVCLPTVLSHELQARSFLCRTWLQNLKVYNCHCILKNDHVACLLNKNMHRSLVRRDIILHKRSRCVSKL